MENMKIIALKHKVCKNQNFENYFKKISFALKYKPDIVLGPDYGLSFVDDTDKINFSMRDKIISRLEKLSKDFPDTFLIPGTTPFSIGEFEMGHSAMIFKEGKKIYEFRKETCVGDQEIAEKNGRNYVSGNSDNNFFYVGNKKIAVEICSDHGKQKIAEDTFAELILAYDDRAGFWVRANNDYFSRFAIVCDGRAPKTEGFRYNHDSINKKWGMLKGKHLSNDLHFFELHERNVSYLQPLCA